MADNHKGYGMPVGGVAVHKNKVPPAGVGFDNACGNKAVLTSLGLGDIEGRLSRQLGMIRSGNHYIDVFADEADRIGVGAHFGSCGLGHAIATHFMKRARDNETPTCWIPIAVTGATISGRCG